MDIQNNRKVKYTKLVLKNSIVELLKHKPLSKITVKELCELSDINRGTFYTHYTDVYDLLDKISKAFIEDISAYLSTFTEDEHDSSYDYTDIVEKIFEYIFKNNALCSAILSDNASIDIENLILTVLKEDVMYLDVSALTSKGTTAYIYSYTAAGCAGLIKTWINNGLKETPAEMTKIAIKLVNCGIMSFNNQC